MSKIIVEDQLSVFESLYFLIEIVLLPRKFDWYEGEGNYPTARASVLRKAKYYRLGLFSKFYASSKYNFKLS